MNCCPNCFTDREIRSIINGISNQVGICDFCHNVDVIIMVDELEMNLSPLLDIYEIAPNAPKNLTQTIQDEWSIFASEQLCTAVLHEIYDKTAYKPLLENPIRLKYTDLGDSDKIWHDFVDEIKNTNRFFINNNVVVRDVVQNLLKHHTKTTKAGTRFYRGRICGDVRGYEEKDLWQPPCEKATAGRANPSGISYLYLANDIITTLYEVRASFLDYVCIGEFQLIEDVSIVALSDIHNPSPFLEDIDLKEYITNKSILSQFGAALSKPLRRFDSALEYLPTQYLCEYIKSLGISGVEYASAMHKDGINYAFFDPSKFKFISASTKEVCNISIEAREV